MSHALLGTEALPTEIAIGDFAYPIRHDFRSGIRFESAVFDGAKTNAEKVALGIEAWFGDEIPDADIGAVIAGMLDFYRCGKPESDGGGSGKRVYDYEYDADLIYAAFREAYGLDLDASEYLHWWQFRAMLMALPSDCQFMRVIGYRSAKITRDMGKEQKAYLRRMKSLYALPLREGMRPKRLRTRAEYDEALAAVLAAKREGLPC